MNFLSYHGCNVALSYLNHQEIISPAEWFTGASIGIPIVTALVTMLFILIAEDETEIVLDAPGLGGYLIVTLYTNPIGRISLMIIMSAQKVFRMILRFLKKLSNALFYINRSIYDAPSAIVRIIAGMFEFARATIHIARRVLAAVHVGMSRSRSRLHALEELLALHNGNMTPESTWVLPRSR